VRQVTAALCPPSLLDPLPSFASVRLQRHFWSAAVIQRCVTASKSWHGHASCLLSGCGTGRRHSAQPCMP